MRFRACQFLLAATLPLASCADPPDPPPAPSPVGVPRWSTTLWVSWAGPSLRSGRPLAVFVDEPGGPLDRIAADDDVTTFLNDRFEPWFLIPTVAPTLGPAPRMWFLDAQGCLLASSGELRLPAEWIDLANAVVMGLGSTKMRAGIRPTPRFDGLELPPGHPLQSMCIPPSPP